MSIKVTVNAYTDLCASYIYGKEFLDLPIQAQDALDDYFDGMELDFYDPYASTWYLNPDNLYVNYFNIIDPDEVDEDMHTVLFLDTENRRAYVLG